MAFRWWGAHSTLSNNISSAGHQGGTAREEVALDASVTRDANPRGYTDSTRSASFPTEVNNVFRRGLPGDVFELKGR